MNPSALHASRSLSEHPGALVASPQTPIPTIHLGMPKTATKTLQMGLFARHSQVDYLGTYSYRANQFRKCRDHEIEQLITQLIWDQHESPDWDLCHQLYAKAVKPSMNDGKFPVWSWESLIENNPDIQRLRAENLKKVFGDCRIIVTIRHPVKLIESLYLQLLKRDHVGALAEFGKPVNYLTIDQWMSQYWGHVGAAPNAQLEYANCIEMYAEVFGFERVKVFLFEHLIDDPEGYYRSICEFIGIDQEEAIQLADGERQNERWTNHQLERLRAVSQSRIKATIFRYLSKSLRRKMLGFSKDGRAATNDRSGPARVKLSLEWQQRIAEKTCAGNRRLMEDWSLPLDQYQYPL